MNIPLFELLYLYFAGKRICVKVCFERVEKLVRVHIQDFEYVTFRGALNCLQVIARNVLTDVTPEELEETNKSRGGVL